MEIYRELNAGDYCDLASLSVWEIDHAIMILLGYTYDNDDYPEPQQEMLEAESEDLINELWYDHESGGMILEGIIKTAVLSGDLAVIKVSETGRDERIRPRELIAFLRDNPAASKMLDLSVWNKYFPPAAESLPKEESEPAEEKQPTQEEQPAAEKELVEKEQSAEKEQPAESIETSKKKAPAINNVTECELKMLLTLKEVKEHLVSVIYATLHLGIKIGAEIDFKTTRAEFLQYMHKMLRNARMDDLSNHALGKIWRHVPTRNKHRGRQPSQK